MYWESTFAVPWGVLVSIGIPELRDKKRFLLVVLVGITVIEAIQVFKMLSIFDVDDIWMNMVGAYAGPWIWQYIRKES